MGPGHGAAVATDNELAGDLQASGLGMAGGLPVRTWLFGADVAAPERAQKEQGKPGDGEFDEPGDG